MSANLELLSSNSKRTPASPRAASTAISGHADQDQVVMEQAQGEYKIAKSDPFQANGRKWSSFIRRLTGSIEQPVKGAEGVEDVTEDTRAGASPDKPIQLGDNSSSSSGESSPPSKDSLAATSGHTGISQSMKIYQIQEPESSRSRVAGSAIVKPLATIEDPAVRPGYRSQPESPLRDNITPVNPSFILQHQMAPPDGNRQNVPEAVEAPHADDANMEGDTLVDLDFEGLPQAQNEAPVTPFRSSPPPMGPPSSHSSTSAESEPKTDPPVPPSQAEEMEWEASLHPYQRDLKDQLFRVSNRVLQHIIDNESAVSDIANTYAKDGQHSLDLLFKSHEKTFNTMHKDMEQKKTNLQEATQKVLSKLRQERETVVDEAG